MGWLAMGQPMTLFMRVLRVGHGQRLVASQFAVE
jgi:hypothetical protein